MELHIFGPGFSTLVRSVRLHCEEKELFYTYGMEIEGVPVSWYSESHLAQHPFAKVPVLLHEEKRVFETIAICRYLDALFPERCSAEDLNTRTLIDQWASALVTTVDAALVRNYLLPIAGPNRSAFIEPPMLAKMRIEAESILAVLEAQLGNQPFLCGNRFSMADALLIPMLDYLEPIAEPTPLLDSRPRLSDYLVRMRERPSSAVLRGD